MVCTLKNASQKPIFVTCLHWRWNPRQSPVRPCGQPWAALLGTTCSSAVAGHACCPSGISGIWSHSFTLSSWKGTASPSDKDAPVPLQNQWDIQDYHSTGHCILQWEGWEPRGLWVIWFMAPTSSMGDLIESLLHAVLPQKLLSQLSYNTDFMALLPRGRKSNTWRKNKYPKTSV